MPWSIEVRKAKHAAQTRRKRERMRAAGVCVNGWSHGQAVKGGRCQACWDKKRGVVAIAPKETA